MSKDYTIKDSGKRQKFSTGARRDLQTGKGRFDLLPARAIMALARHFEKGSFKYGDRNWEKGMPLSRYASSAMSHSFKFLKGDIDENHLVACFWNWACLLDTQLRIEEGLLPKELDDLPKLNKKCKE